MCRRPVLWRGSAPVARGCEIPAGKRSAIRLYSLFLHTTLGKPQSSQKSDALVAPIIAHAALSADAEDVLDGAPQQVPGVPGVTRWRVASEPGTSAGRIMALRATATASLEPPGLAGAAIRASAPHARPREATAGRGCISMRPRVYPEAYAVFDFQ